LRLVELHHASVSVLRAIDWSFGSSVVRTDRPAFVELLLAVAVVQVARTSSAKYSAA